MRALAAAVFLLLLALPAQSRPSDAPTPGTTLEYQLRSSGGAPDGSFRQVTGARLVLTFDGEAWTGSCTGTTTTAADGVTTSESFTRGSAMPPPRVEGRLHRGDTFDPGVTSAAAQGCRHDLGPMVVLGRSRDGSKHMLAAEPGEASPYQDASLTWDPRSGLLHSWSFAGRGGGFEGRLVP